MPSRMRRSPAAAEPAAAPEPPATSSAGLPAPPAPAPNCATATFVDPSTPKEDLPCYAEGALGAAPTLALERLIFASGQSCSKLSRHELTFALGSIAAKVTPRPGTEAWPKVLAAAEAKALIVRGGTPKVFREAHDLRSTTS